MMNDEEKLHRLFAKLPQEELPEDFSMKLHRKLQKAVAEKEQKSNWLQELMTILIMPRKLVLVGAMALFLFVLVSPLFKTPDFISVTMYNNNKNNVQVGEVVLLRVEFKAAKDIADVAFKVELPRGVVFVSAHDSIANSKSLAFNGSIKEEKPIVLPVAIRLKEKGKYKIKVEASSLGKKSITISGRG
jgi:hypothetical protein